jgi:hypothetical protein
LSDRDARTKSLAELHERRKQVIRLHKRQYGVMQIVELTGLSWPAVPGAIDLYEAGGIAAIKPKPRRKRSGEGRILTPDQEAHLQKLIVEKLGGTGKAPRNRRALGADAAFEPPCSFACLVTLSTSG